MKVATTFELFCEAGSTVVDVGAYVGHTALLMASLVGADGQVIAVEAHPERYLRLANTVSRSKAGNILPIMRAISNSTGRCAIFSGNAAKADQASTIMAELATKGRFGDVIEQWTVEMESLDSLCKRFDLAPEFIKVDVEGAEHLVFQGAFSTLSTIKPALYFECGFDGRIPEHFHYLPNLGYQLICADLIHFAGKWFSMDHPGIENIASPRTPQLLERLARGAVMNVIAVPTALWPRIADRVTLLTDTAFMRVIETVAGNS